MPERPPGSPPFPLSQICELQDWVLDVRCGRCGKRARKPVAMLSGHLSGKSDIMRAVGRLRCDRLTGQSGAGRCNGKPDFVALLRFDLNAKRATEIQRITVLGDVPIW
jgi:hypothetical protein